MKLALLVLFLLKVVLANEDPFELPIFGINASTGNQVRCGKQNPGVKCLNGMCCSVYGWCGNTQEHCASGYCESQCCGSQADGRLCSTGECCSKDGKCGTTSKYCAPPNCQTQCETPPASHSSSSPLLVGLFIFLIVVALVFYRRFANSPMFSSLN
ncbi:hypothetical protein AABB24_026991 [Solanum stoloniferum]|uniref:Chitin-binding type-1 domain-containing protein n=1 Tax=Solanum stoloniferum TaxID=62892 RepID=A0ABD2SH84_9SOLN